MAGMLGGANHLGTGERPSESHHWVPGMGWVFMPTYAEGESLNEQSAAAGGKSFDIAVDRQSLADTEATGVRSHSSLNEGGLTHEQRAAIKERQQSHLWYQGGMDHYDGSIGQDGWETAASEYFNSIGSPQAVSPWQHTSDWAKADTFKAIQEANYNPFIGNEGAWVTPGGENGQDLRGSNNGTAEGYRDDSIAGWFKDQFAGKDMIGHRRDAIMDLKKWSSRDRAEDGTSRDINKATTRMNQRVFDEMGLAEKYGLEFVDPRQEAYDKMVAGFSSGGESTGGFMDAYNSQRPVNPAGLATGGARPAAPAGPQVKPGGFMESYLKKKAENKPSVMSLMTELKDA